jgi:hypothetical protein
VVAIIREYTKTKIHFVLSSYTVIESLSIHTIFHLLIVSECTHLSKTECRQLPTVLQEYETLFDGTLAYWKNEQYNIELQSDA